MEIKITVEYEYNPYSPKPCIAYIGVLLPSGPDGWMDERVVSARKDLLGKRLTGTWDGTGRTGRVWQRWTVESALSWEELETLIDSEVEEIRAVLEDVIQQNRHLAATRPSDREFTIRL